MEYKAIETSFWRDPKVKKMSTDEKLLFLYFMTSPHSQLSGLYWIPLEYAQIETGLERAAFQKAVANLEKKWKVLVYDTVNSFVWVKNMFKYHPSCNSKSTKIGIARYIKKNANETPLALQFFEYYKKNSELPLSLSDFRGGPLGGAPGGPRPPLEGGLVRRREENRIEKEKHKDEEATKMVAATARVSKKKTGSKTEKAKSETSTGKTNEAHDLAAKLEAKVEAAFKKAKKKRRPASKDQLFESATAIKEVHDEDKIPFDEIDKMIEWMHKGKAAKFWATTVLNGAGLRKNLNQIIGQMVRADDKNQDEIRAEPGGDTDSGRYKD